MPQVMVTNVLMLATLVFAVAWALRGFVKDTWSPDGSLIVWVTLIFMLLVANKVFSPQYILWLGAPSWRWCCCERTGRNTRWRWPG